MNVYVVVKCLKDNEEYVTEMDNKYCDIEYFNIRSKNVHQVFASLNSAKEYIEHKEVQLKRFGYTVKFNDKHTKIEGLKEVRDYVKHLSYVIQEKTLHE